MISEVGFPRGEKGPRFVFSYSSRADKRASNVLARKVKFWLNTFDENILLHFNPVNGLLKLFKKFIKHLSLSVCFLAAPLNDGNYFNGGSSNISSSHNHSIF